MDKITTLRTISRNMREHNISYYALEKYVGRPRSTIMRALTMKHEARDAVVADLLNGLQSLADDKGLKLV